MIKLYTLTFLLVLPWLSFAQAKICFETTKLDAGEIEYGSNGQFIYKFTNCGNQPLIISRGQTSCGCLVCYWPKDPIMPGKTGKIELKYDTKRVGPTTKTATITSNCSENPSIVLVIKCVVLPIARAIVSDSTINFGNVKAGSRLSFELKNNYHTTLTILKIEPVAGNSTNLIPVSDTLGPAKYSYGPDGPDRNSSLPSTRLEFDVDSKAGSFRKEWYVFLDDGRKPILLTATGKVIK